MTGIQYVFYHDQIRRKEAMAHSNNKIFHVRQRDCTGIGKRRNLRGWVAQITIQCQTNRGRNMRRDGGEVTMRKRWEETAARRALSKEVACWPYGHRRQDSPDFPIAFFPCLKLYLIYSLRWQHALLSRVKTGNTETKGTMMIWKYSVLVILWRTKFITSTVTSWVLTIGQPCSEKDEQCLARRPGSGPGVIPPLCWSVL